MVRNGRKLDEIPISRGKVRNRRGGGGGWAQKRRGVRAGKIGEEGCYKQFLWLTPFGWRAHWRRKARTLGWWDARTSATCLTVIEQLYGLQRMAYYRSKWALLQWHPDNRQQNHSTEWDCFKTKVRFSDVLLVSHSSNTKNDKTTKIRQSLQNIFKLLFMLNWSTFRTYITRWSAGFAVGTAERPLERT